jgi:hypothetical protein
VPSRKAHSIAIGRGRSRALQDVDVMSCFYFIHYVDVTDGTDVRPIFVEQKRHRRRHHWTGRAMASPRYRACSTGGAQRSAHVPHRSRTSGTSRFHSGFQPASARRRISVEPPTRVTLRRCAKAPCGAARLPPSGGFDVPCEVSTRPVRGSFGCVPVGTWRKGAMHPACFPSAPGASSDESRAGANLRAGWCA